MAVIKPACWRWKPPADLGAVILAEEMRKDWLARPDGEGRLRKYGAGIPHQAQWRLLRRWQRGRCAICGTAYRETGNLVKDHSHSTGLVRGLLCWSCNTGEGCGWPDEFDMYRERPPAAICGVRLVYNWSQTQPCHPERH